jgi:hypothetical protein
VSGLWPFIHLKPLYNVLCIIVAVGSNGLKLDGVVKRSCGFCIFFYFSFKIKQQNIFKRLSLLPERAPFYLSLKRNDFSCCFSKSIMSSLKTLRVLIPWDPTLSSPYDSGRLFTLPCRSFFNSGMEICRLLYLMFSFIILPNPRGGRIKYITLLLNADKRFNHLKTRI